jgi:hypothetical protein
MINNNHKQFKRRYLELRGSSPSVPVPTKKPAASKFRRSIVLNDEDADMPGPGELHLDPSKPWLDEFNLYLNTLEVVPEGMDTIRWWGVRI